MTRPIKTVKKTKNMPSGAVYVATDHDGAFWAFTQKPTFDPTIWRWDGVGGWPVAMHRPPADASATLRRIVDPPKKPKRKMPAGVLAVRKKPVEVSAMLFTGRGNSCTRCALWIGAAAVPRPPAGLGIKTLEGVMWASPGDYIIRGVHGEHYPCKPDIFAKTYDVVPAPRRKGEK